MGDLGPGSTGEAAQTVVRGEGLEAWEGVQLLCLGSRERWCISNVSRLLRTLGSYSGKLQVV